MERIQKFFGVGKIYVKDNDSISYLVTSVKDLQVIIEHFEKYPLHTQKGADFKLFQLAFNLVVNQEHLTLDGLRKIVAIKSSMNLGLSSKLEEYFPDVVPMDRPLVLNQTIKNPMWLAGFVSAEGSFLISIFKSKTLTGFAVRLRFNLTQHSRDALLMKSLVDYLGCGRYVAGPSGYSHGEFIVSNLSDITKVIMPFFIKYSIQGVKFLDFQDWCKAAKLMENKAHLTPEGLDQMRLIKSGINRGR